MYNIFVMKSLGRREKKGGGGGELNTAMAYFKLENLLMICDIIITVYLIQIHKFNVFK